MFIYYRLLHSISELNSEFQILLTPALLFHEDSAQYTLSPLKIIYYYPNAIRSQGNIWQKDLELTSLMVPRHRQGPPCVVSEPGPSDTLIQRSLGTAQSTLLGFNGYGVRGRGRNTNIGPQSAPTQCQGLPRNKKNLWLWTEDTGHWGLHWRIMLLWRERSLNQQPLYYKLLSLLSYYIRPRLEEIN